MPGNAQYDKPKSASTDTNKAAFRSAPPRKKLRDRIKPSETFSPTLSKRLRGDKIRFMNPSGALSCFIQRDASIGTTVKASNRDKKMATEIIKATGPNKVPTSPVSIKTGMKT